PTRPSTLSLHDALPIYQRLLERMPHVQGAGDVGWRQLDAIGRPGVVGARRKIAGGFPALVPALLDRRGVEALVQHLLALGARQRDRKSTRLNSSHVSIS